MNIFKNVLIVFIISMIWSPISNSATVSKEASFARSIGKSGITINCRPQISGWFKGYAVNTTFAFSGSFLAVYATSLIKSDTGSYIGGKMVVDEVYHLIQLTGATYFGRSGHVYDLDLGPVGVALIDYSGSENVTLSVTAHGDSSTTQFNCQDEIDDMF